MRTYTSAQKHKKAQYDISYRKRNEEKRRSQVAEYYRKHKPKIRKWLNEWQNRWRKTLRGRISMRLSNAMRRFRIRETKDGTVTRDAVESMLKNQENKCQICGEPLRTKSMHLDHIIPLVSGGRHTISNLQWTCSKCNLKKHKTRLGVI